MDQSISSDHKAKKKTFPVTQKCKTRTMCTKRCDAQMMLLPVSMGLNLVVVGDDVSECVWNVRPQSEKALLVSDWLPPAVGSLCEHVPVSRSRQPVTYRSTSLKPDIRTHA
jgi:hypothetical protein